MGKSPVIGMRRGLVAAGLALCAAVGVSGCTAQSYAGISLEPGAAPAEVRALAARARRGDRWARFELAERLADGRGMPTDPQAARALFLDGVAISGRETIFVPVNGVAVAQTVAIGKVPAWPDPKHAPAKADGVKIASIVRLCAMDGSAEQFTKICEPDKVELLTGLVKTELNFLACRLQFNLGNAGPNPYSFVYNAVDYDLGLKTRACLYDTAPKFRDLDHKKSDRVWKMLFLTLAYRDCADFYNCDKPGLRHYFEEIYREDEEDSLLTFVAMNFLDIRYPRAQVGTGWWRSTCREFSQKRNYDLRKVEAELCFLSGFTPKRSIG